MLTFYLNATFFAAIYMKTTKLLLKRDFNNSQPEADGVRGRSEKCDFTCYKRAVIAGKTTS